MNNFLKVCNTIPVTNKLKLFSVVFPGKRESGGTLCLTTVQTKTVQQTPQEKQALPTVFPNSRPASLPIRPATRPATRQQIRLRTAWTNLIQPAILIDNSCLHGIRKRMHKLA